jgi:hypothetical protein
MPVQVCLLHESSSAFCFLCFLCFLAACFGAGCAAGVVLAVGAAEAEAGAGVASAAQTGTTIKANNSNKYFMLKLP